ncbi:MAG: hypothetical protein M3063_09825 [Actinomycetota bacterium]|nr:hypothetical protein [Actinomycetota bacterium]
MRQLISGYVDRNDPALVIIQSIGRPKPLEATWTDTLAPAVASVGGAPDVFNTSNAEGRPPGGYSLVGGARLGAHEAAEASPSMMGTPARLTGMLSRNRQGQFRAAHASSPSEQTSEADQIDLSMLPLAYQPASQWPTPTSTGQVAATAWVAQQTKSTLNLPPDIRSVYTDDTKDTTYWNRVVGWFNDPDHTPTNFCPAPTQGAGSTPGTTRPADAAQAPETTPASGPTPTSDTTTSTDIEHRRTTTTQGTTTTTTGGNCVSTFTKVDYDTIKSTFTTELEEVGNVRGTIAGMENTARSAQANDQWDVKTIADGIYSSLHPPASQTSFVANLVIELVSAAMRVTAGIIGASTPGIGAWLGVLTSTMSLGMGSVQLPGGAPAAAPLQVRANELAEQLDHAYSQYTWALDHVGDILVTDANKLATASTNSAGQGKWTGNTETEESAMTQMSTATDQLIYQSLMPLVYQDYELRPGPGVNSENSYDAGSYNCFALANSQEFQPFRGASAQSQYQAVAAFEGDKPVRYVHVLATGNSSGQKYEFKEGHYPLTTYGASLPSGALMRDLFSRPPPVGSGVGFAPEAFFGSVPHVVVQCLRPI